MSRKLDAKKTVALEIRDREANVSGATIDRNRDLPVREAGYDAVARHAVKKGERLCSHAI